MADDKPWYTLEIKLTASKVDKMTAAVTKLDEITSEHSTPGTLKFGVKFESFQEETLQAIREQFEVWLRQQRLGIEGDVVMKAPVVRPRPEQAPDLFDEVLPSGGRIDSIEFSSRDGSVTTLRRSARG